MACNHPEEVKPGGRDPKIYEEEVPSGGQVTSRKVGGYRLFVKIGKRDVWVTNGKQSVRYGTLTKGSSFVRRDPA